MPATATTPASEFGCSLLLFVATPAEEEALRDQAHTLGLDWRADAGLTNRLNRLGLREGAWLLGSIGGETVAAVGCSRVRGQVVMGPHGRLGSAAKSLRYLSATGAQGVIQVGTAFGISRKTQAIGDVLVSTGLLPYDQRDVRASADPPGYQNDYSQLTTEPARPALVERCRREAERVRAAARDGSPRGYRVHVGALLSGSARVHCARYRDELYKQVPHGNEPIVGGEMEGVGLLAAEARADDPAWCIVKGISDFGDEQRREEYVEGRKLAARNAAHFVLSSLVSDAASFS